MSSLVIEYFSILDEIYYCRNHSALTAAEDAVLYSHGLKRRGYGKKEVGYEIFDTNAISDSHAHTNKTRRGNVRYITYKYMDLDVKIWQIANFVQQQSVSAHGFIIVRGKKVNLLYKQYQEVLHPAADCQERKLVIRDGVVIPYVDNPSNQDLLAMLMANAAVMREYRFAQVYNCDKRERFLTAYGTNFGVIHSQLIGWPDIFVSYCGMCEPGTSVQCRAALSARSEVYRVLQNTIFGFNKQEVKHNIKLVSSWLSFVQMGIVMLHKNPTSYFSRLPLDIWMYVIKPYILT